MTLTIGSGSAYHADMSKTYESLFQLGERVILAANPTALTFGYIRAVTFTSSKVRYAIWIKETSTTLHNVDSTVVDPVGLGAEEIITMPEDNYS